MCCVPVNVAGRNAEPAVISVEEGCCEQLLRHKRDDCEEAKHNENQKIQKSRRKNAEEASNIKSFEADTVLLPFFFEQSGTDKQATDAEEKVNPVKAVVIKPTRGKRTKRVEGIVIENHGENSERPPAIKRREVTLLCLHWSL